MQVTQRTHNRALCESKAIARGCCFSPIDDYPVETSWLKIFPNSGKLSSSLMMVLLF
ncbi:hypothetical protein [Nostoc sp. LPT]|uniref:hypothetical protein n=1 Tax=Nostoc sp. LPT TaxID=2815387 RepID=UPI0025D6FBC2|nr:hypothetical protein [Nostoc sp. LPT]